MNSLVRSSYPQRKGHASELFETDDSLLSFNLENETLILACDKAEKINGVSVQWFMRTVHAEKKAKKQVCFSLTLCQSLCSRDGAGIYGSEDSLLAQPVFKHAKGHKIHQELCCQWKIMGAKARNHCGGTRLQLTDCPLQVILTSSKLQENSAMVFKIQWKNSHGTNIFPSWSGFCSLKNVSLYCWTHLILIGSKRFLLLKATNSLPIRSIFEM